MPFRRPVLWLLCIHCWVSPVTAQQPYLPETAYLELDGTRLYYETAGQGFPVLLVHAGVADSRMWDGQFRAWSQTNRVIRCDLRGFGRTELAAGEFSDHGDLARLLTHLGVDRAIVAGASYGGQVAIDLCLAYPQRVAALVLAAPNVGGWPGTDELHAFASAETEALKADDLEAAVALNVHTWVDGPLRAATAVEPQVRNAVAAMQKHIFEMVIPEGFVPHELDPPAWGRLDQIQAPTLVLVGELDLASFRDLAQQVTQAIPGATQVTLPGVAHLPAMEAPAQFNQAVSGFLQQHSQP